MFCGNDILLFIVLDWNLCSDRDYRMLSFLATNQIQFTKQTETGIGAGAYASLSFFIQYTCETSDIEN